MKQRPFMLVGVFLYLWLMVGFFAGTLTLLGPVRWISGAIRTRGGSQGMEDAAVALVILLFVAASIVLARMAVRYTLRAKHVALRAMVPLALTGLSAVALWGWMNPGTLDSAEVETIESVRTESGAQFIFGPYPDKDRLEELKREGFTGVVSLLHPAVVPFEPKILRDELENAREVGLRLVHAPMLPWVGSNEASLARVRTLAENPDGIYYVHCYLGRDRVNVVKRVLAEQGVAVEGATDLQDARGLEERTEPFERGPLLQLEPDLWLAPYPNEHEFFGYLLFGNVRHVVLALDSADARQREWLAEARRLLADYAVEHSVRPVGVQDAQAASALAADVRGLPRPLVIVVPWTETEDGGDTRVAELVRAAFARTQPDALPPTRDGTVPAARQRVAS